MCGRFVLFTESLLDEVGELPGVTEVHAPQGTPGPRYNIAPTQPVAIVRVRESLAQVDPARWALLPHWKKDLEGPPLFNARAETVASKPSFRHAFKGQRCLIPMNGYYEWRQEEGGKQP
ncbi:MAG: SOS response-associated peptidase, partial [Corynebacterium sp.]